MRRVLIDADGCPVVDLTIKLASKADLEVLIFCDSSHHFEREGAQTIVIMKGPDAVDFKLVNAMDPGDIVITQDYGLAAMALAKGGHPLSQNGLVYTHENISPLLESRLAHFKARKQGARMRGPKKRSKNDDLKFEAALTSLLFNVDP